MAENSAVLPQAAGYGVVIGMGFAISLLILGFTKLQTRYTQYKTTSAEEFNSASRSVPPGLIAAGIVSAWTWAATLLQSSATAYKFGVSGPWWYASGAVIQILLFAMIASKLKMNAPYCHTFLEIIKVRWGTAAHIVFTFFGLATNIIVSTMLILGGSATVTDLTSMNTVAACFLIPLGVSIYVLAGGMRASLIADYSHTIVLYAILLAFAMTVYATSPILGSPRRVWELLRDASIATPVAGNAEGSYLTMRSKSGLIFGVLNIVGNFGTVFNDQAYWQRAIASTPQTSVKAFLMGGIAWFGIPMGIATSMGLAAVALKNQGLITLTPEEISAGLPAVKAAAALMGQSGGLAMLFLLFLAVTSAVSTEQVAVSNILTYDIYATYVNKNPTEKQILWISRVTIAMYCVVMGGIATAFNYIGVSMGYLYVLMGCIIGCAVVPIAMCITWKKCNGTGATVGCVVGFCSAITGWLVCTAKLNDGVINVETTAQDYCMLTGNLLSIGVGGIITVVWSLVRPANFDWELTRAINQKAAPGAIPATTITNTTEDGVSPATSASGSKGDEKNAYVDAEGKGETPATVPATPRGTHDADPVDVDTFNAALESKRTEEEKDMEGLRKAFRFAAISALTLTFILIFLIPLPLFFSQHVYPVGGFTAYVVVSIIWLFVGGFLVGIFPLWEARKGIWHICTSVVADIRGTLQRE